MSSAIINAFEIAVKLSYEGELRRFSVTKGISFASLCEQVNVVLGLDKTTPLVLKYTDEEGDLITITSDLELNSGIVPGQLLRLTAANKSAPRATVPLANSIGPGSAPTGGPGMLGAFGKGPGGAHSFGRGRGGWKSSFTPEEWAQLKEERAAWCKLKKERKATMTPEQWAQLKEIKEERKRAWKDHKKGGFGGGRGHCGPHSGFGHHHHAFAPKWDPAAALATGEHHGRFRGCDGGEKLVARFTKDVTFEDGAEVAAGAPFVKTWRIRNEGAQWPVGCVLRLLSGRSDTMGSPEFVPVPFEGPVAAGQEFDISVPLVAPAKAGRYTAYFKMCTPAGKKFGQRLWVSIAVPAASSSSSSSEGEKEADKYEHLVDSVLAMGFTVKRHRVFRLLQMCDGDVDRVVQMLYAKTQHKAAKQQMREQKALLKGQMKEQKKALKEQAKAAKQ